MPDMDFSRLEVSAENKRKAQNKTLEITFQKYLEKYRNDYYIIGNLENKGLSEDLKKELEDTHKIKKIGVGWQLSTIDCFAMEDFLRAYNCSKTDVATFALRYYLPPFIYDKATIKCISLIKNIPIEDRICIPDIKVTSIDDYNNMFNKHLVDFNLKYQGKLESFSWDFYKVDLVAVQLFKKLYGFTYNSIIQNAIRSFLMEQNYKNGELLLRIIKRQDERRKY